MAAVLMPEGKQSFTTNTGQPLVGGKLYTYAAGTSTLKATYADAAGTVPNTNPITLDARGEAVVFWSGAYKVALKDSAGVTIWTVDGVSGADTLDAALRADLASTASGKGAGMMGVADAGSYLAGATVEAALQELSGPGRGGLFVTQFGSLALAHAAATAAGVPLLFPAGTYSAGTGSFSIDLTKTEWVNLGGAVVQWTGAPALGYGVRLVGTSTYTSAWQSARALRLPTLLGGASAAALYAGSALQIGDGATYTQQIEFRANIQGFVNCVEYLDNTWSITGTGRWMWGNVKTPTSPVNFAEAMAFRDVFFADGPVITLGWGDWHFSGGSLDNAQLVLNGAAQVVWDAPHLENPGSTANAPLMIDVAGVEALCILNGAHLIFNNPGGSGITDAPFRVSSSNITAGLVINGIQYSQQSFINTQTSDDYATLVRSGGGRVAINGIAPRALSNYYFLIGSASANQLANGGFEGASLAGWATSGTGTSAQDATQHITGKRITSAKSAKLTVAAATNYAQLAQTARCTVGQLASLQVWCKGDGVAGHDGQVKIDFLDSQGNSIAGASVSGAVSSNGSVWTLYRLAAFAPAGAQSAYITFNAFRSSSDGSVWYDEAVLNVT